MANDISFAVFTGRLTRDPELKEAGQGQVCNIGIAVNKSRKNAEGEYVESVSYFNFNVWDNYGALVARKLQKGDKVTITSEPKEERWEDKNDGSKRSKVVFRINEIVSDGMFRTADEEKENEIGTAPAGEVALGDTPEAPVEAAVAAPAAPTTDDIPF